MLRGRDSSTIELAIQSVAEQLVGWVSGRSWHSLTDEELHDTLVGCILSTAIRHETTVSIFDRLSRASLTPIRSRVSLDHWENDVRSALAGRGPFGVDGPSHRFPNASARHLRRTYESLGRDLRSLRRILVEARSGKAARARLMAVVSGFGPKQASSFLRNIGYCSDLAILDVHVLRYMSYRRLCSGTVEAPRSLRDYEPLEDRLLAFSRGRGISLERFDIAIWIVMRSAAAA